MANEPLFLENDHLVVLRGMKDATTLLYIDDADVDAFLLSGIGGTPITGGGPITMTNIPPGTVGGAGSDTVAKTKARAGDRLLTVTVGATVALALDAADWIRFHGHDQPYQISVAAAGAAGTDVILLLEEALRADVKADEPVFAVSGVYQGTLEDTVSVVSGTDYAFEITATGGVTNIDSKTHKLVTATDRED